MKTKSVVLIITTTLILLAAAIAGAGWVLYYVLSGRMYGYTPPQTPAQLKQPRIVVGNKVLKSIKFLELSSWGEITGKEPVGSINDISVGEWDSQAGIDVVVAGSSGVMILDATGARRSQIPFHFKVVTTSGPFGVTKAESMLGDIQIVDIEGDGKCEYLGRGGWDGAALFDQSGKLLWSYGKRSDEKGSIDNVTVGDLDQDGVCEIVVSWDGVEVFDRSGKKLNQISEEYGASQIEVIDTDNDGKNEIISIGGSLKIRNAKGEVSNEIDVPVYFGDFSLLKTSKNNQTIILGMYDGELLLINLKGEVITRFKAPLSEFDDTVQKVFGEEMRGTDVFKAEGVWIKLSKDQPEYLAVITNFAGIDRSVLDVFDPSGKLIYQEVLPEDCQSIASLPSDDQNHPEQLLVGGESTVWKYKMP